MNCWRKHWGRAMSEPTKTLVPKLRFPEFLDVGEWKQSKLGERAVSIFVKERTPLQNLSLDNYVSTENLLPDFAGVINAAKLPPNGSFTRFKEGDVLISNIRPYLKKVWSANKNGASSNDVIVIRAQSSISDSFLTFLLKNDNFIDYIMKGAKGVKMPRGDISLMKEYPVAIPSPKEQQKIADCLSSIDELITAQTNKIAALKNHKKGLMQQLFPLEGETIPKLRFPEFQDAGEWDQDKLENLINTVTPPQKLPTALYQAEGQFPIIDQSQSYICGWTNNQDALIVNDLPLIIFGDHTCVLKIVNLPFAQGADGIKILKTKERVETNYLYQYLQFNPVVMEEYKRHFSILKEKMISFPKIETGEQQKIADCLSSIDDLITTHTQKLEAYKAHKKGLMQQLFPNTDEVGE